MHIHSYLSFHHQYNTSDIEILIQDLEILYEKNLAIFNAAQYAL